MRKEPYSPAVKPTNVSLSLGRICNTASVMTSPLDSLLYSIFLFVPYVVDAIRLDPKTHFPSTAPYAEYFPPPSPDSDLWQRSSSPKKQHQVIFFPVCLAFRIRHFSHSSGLGVSRIGSMTSSSVIELLDGMNPFMPNL